MNATDRTSQPGWYGTANETAHEAFVRTVIR
jgi:hypothetical protein